MRNPPSHDQNQDSKGKVLALKSPTSRKRSRYCPQRRLEVARVRKAGACLDCRRRKVSCPHALQARADDGLSPKLPFLGEAFPLEANSNMTSKPQPCPFDQSTQQPLTVDCNETSSSPGPRGSNTTFPNQADPKFLLNGTWNMNSQPMGVRIDASQYTRATELARPDLHKIPSAEVSDPWVLPQNTIQPSTSASEYSIETHPASISAKEYPLEVFNTSSFTNSAIDEAFFALTSSSYPDINIVPTCDAGEGTIYSKADTIFDMRPESNTHQIQPTPPPCDFSSPKVDKDQDLLCQDFWIFETSQDGTHSY